MTERFKRVVEIIGAVAAVETIARLVPWPALWRAFRNAYVAGRPAWAWIVAFWLLSIAAAALWAHLWAPDALARPRTVWRRDTSTFGRRILASIAIVLLPLGVAAMLLDGTPPDLDARRLFHQEAEIGPLVLETYGTNGAADFRVRSEDGRRGPGPSYAADISFQAFGDTVEFNCGWVVYFPKGFDLSAYRKLRFMIRGERGDERVVLKAKDVLGRERSFELAGEHYLRQGRLTAQWQEAVVQLADFGDVRFDRIDNISLASNGRLNGMVPQQVVVGAFRFEE